MEEEKFDIQSMVKVETMAVIKQQLDSIGVEIKKKTENIDNVLKEINKLTQEQQEEKKKEIKDYKIYLNKIKTQLEDRRKEIKKEVNKPYEEFNQYYENNVLTQLNEGINKLNDTVNSIEYNQKKEKEEELRDFAEGYIIANDLQPILKFEDIGLNITLNASVKSLKEQILNFIGRVANDMKLIRTEEYGNEIIVEYKKNLDFVTSKMTVIQRHEEIEKLAQKQEEVEIKQQEEQKIVEKVEEVIEINTPKEIISNDEIIEVQFTIKGEKNKIKQVKELIVNLGLEWK